MGNLIAQNGGGPDRACPREGNRAAEALRAPLPAALDARRGDERRRPISSSWDEAWRIAVNIAKLLPELLQRG
jgi:hypothetical protein